MIRTFFLDYVRIVLYTKHVAIPPTNLRKNLYKYLDQVLDSGTPLEINRNGRKLKIVREGHRDIFGNLRKHPHIMRCDPESIVHMDWSNTWNHGLS